MDHCNHVSDWLKTLVNEFDFNMETLSEYLDLSAEMLISCRRIHRQNRYSCFSVFLKSGIFIAVPPTIRNKSSAHF